MKAIAHKLAGIAVAGTVALAACGDGTGPGTQPTMSVQLTDAPTGELANAWVEISKIEVVGTGGPVTLTTESSGLVDLLTLANTTTDLVSDVEIEPGTYTQVRVHVGAAAVQTEEGEVFSKDGAAEELDLTATGTLICPSCEETGIKVNIAQGGITLESESKVLLLDFDARQSFGRQAGMSGNWVMMPLIRAAEITATGSVSGTVSLDDGVTIPECPAGTGRSVEDFVPQLEQSGEVESSGIVDSDGSWSAGFVAPGTYDAGYAESVDVGGNSTLEFTADPSDSQVTVESGQDASLDYTITAASCATSGG